MTLTREVGWALWLTIKTAGSIVSVVVCLPLIFFCPELVMHFRLHLQNLKMEIENYRRGVESRIARRRRDSGECP
jgi:hypothetical protein